MAIRVKLSVILPALFLASMLTAHSFVAAADRGFEVATEAVVTEDERVGQDEFLIMDVELKPVRMIDVVLTDPQTGEKRRELVWYLCYRAKNRFVEKRVDTSDTAPVNIEDGAVAPPLFVPQFTLVTTDDDKQIIYNDQVLLEAQSLINARERRRYMHSVEIIGPVPPATPPSDDAADDADADEEEDDGYIYGVAMWRGVDSETDYFKVFMTGFSNGYRILQDGKLVERKTIVQEYWRPGDAFEENEREIRHRGEPKWIYRPSSAPAATPAGNPVGDDAANDDAAANDDE